MNLLYANFQNCFHKSYTRNKVKVVQYVIIVCVLCIFIGGKLCTFSPCIEQVQKTVEALKRSGCFVMLKTQEVLQRSHSIQYRTLTSLDFTPSSTEDTSDSSGKQVLSIKKEQCKFKTLIPPTQTPGHTGYITFATFIPGDSS